LTVVKDRIVPLQHWSFITATEAIFKIIKDKTLEAEIRSMINKPILLQNAKNQFNEENYHRVMKTLDVLETKRVFIKRPFVLNKVCEYMVQNNMLPCACFILSRKQIEVAAREVTTILLEDDSKIPYIIRRECEQILRKKLPNFEEYLQLPEYNEMVALLEKGIGTHHAGTLPILKEIVELMFSKGYIKLLFCSETFSMGLNMPIKTVIFTDIMKYDGRGFRVLHGHEYNQAGGRAGRRGLDTVGNVIHLNNLFKKVEKVDYISMMKGAPQVLLSKFKISPHLILNRIENGDMDFVGFAEKSIMQEEIMGELRQCESDVDKAREELVEANMYLDQISSTITPLPVMERWLKIKEELTSGKVVNKKRRELEREKETLSVEWRRIEIHSNSLLKKKECEEKLYSYECSTDYTRDYLRNTISQVVDFLVKEKMIEEDITCHSYTLTHIGLKATHIRELPCFFANILHDESWEKQSLKQMIRVLSCFTNISVPEEKRVPLNALSNRELLEKTMELFVRYEDYEDEDMRIHFDLYEYMGEWVDADDAESCKRIIQRMETEKEIFLGDFVKAVIKIVNSAAELEKIAELTGNMSLLEKYKEIPKTLLKYIVINQSLYV
jgi:superfamily II RNA helicase